MNCFTDEFRALLASPWLTKVLLWTKVLLDNTGISPAFGLDLAYVIFKVKFTTSNMGLNYCVHAHPPVRQVVARSD